MRFPQVFPVTFCNAKNFWTVNHCNINKDVYLVKLNVAMVTAVVCSPTNPFLCTSTVIHFWLHYLFQMKLTNAMKINPGFPYAKDRPATVLKLSVLLPQHQRRGVSWAEALPRLGDWFWKLMRCSGALCWHNSCRPLFCHSSSWLRAEYLSSSLGTRLGT